MPTATQQARLVSTMVTEDERARIDAAGEGLYYARHQMDPGGVIRDIRDGQGDAVVISLAYCEVYGPEIAGRVTRELPQVPVYALLSGMTTRTPGALLTLGRSGVAAVVDVRTAIGWSKLRELIARSRPDAAERSVERALRHVAPDMNRECRQFFGNLLRLSRTQGSVRGVAETLKVLPSTLMSRFFRAGLPAPKRYLATLRLIRAAFLLENPGFSVVDVANHLEYSSPQSFGRHLRTMTGMTAVEFRRTTRGETMVEAFAQTLIEPYCGVLRDFNPLGVQQRSAIGSTRRNGHTL